MLPVFVFRPLWTFCLLSLASASYCQRVNPNDPSWRNAQTSHEITSYNGTSLLRLCQLSDPRRISVYLDNILVHRPVGSDNHKRVGMYLKRTMEELGYYVEVDRFSEQTIVGSRTFRNIIGVLDPSAPRWLTLACHYDSKDMRPEFDFMGATDSAFPCAVLLDVAHSLSPYISNRAATDVTLQLLFFDGEEAFKDWTQTDSLYGSRHLAKLWAERLYPPYNSYSTREINRIDYLVLLDLLGTAGASIPNYTPTNDPLVYNTFWDTELRLRQLPNCMDTSTSTVFTGYSLNGNVEDDHVPFHQQGVRIMHMIPTPFPRVWHTKQDDRNALEWKCMTNIASIVRAFTARYLGIRI